MSPEWASSDMSLLGHTVRSTQLPADDIPVREVSGDAAAFTVRTHLYVATVWVGLAGVPFMLDWLSKQGFLLPRSAEGDDDPANGLEFATFVMPAGLNGCKLSNSKCSRIVTWLDAGMSFADDETSDIASADYRGALKAVREVESNSEKMLAIIGETGFI
jgi:hypothetical protein